MSKSVKIIVVVLAAVIALGGLVMWLRGNEGGAVARDGGRGDSARRAVSTAERHLTEGRRGEKALDAKAARRRTEEAPAAVEAADSDVEGGEAADEKTPEEKLVDAFDDLTDKWQEPASAKVTMDEVGKFRAAFAKVPPARKDECLHRALNLIPDENVMLLAGILLDKSQDKDILEVVFGDILNRDESVKKPILDEIFKDRTHPCWADTAWILDVTGQLPQNNKGETK
ncbi:MAG: hypothetical protein ACI4RA_11490 [Kiritimatiellia bacterium]